MAWVACPGRSAIALSPESFGLVSESFSDLLFQRRAIQALAQVRLRGGADAPIGLLSRQLVLAVDARKLSTMQAPRKVRGQAEVGAMVAIEVEAFVDGAERRIVLGQGCFFMGSLRLSAHDSSTTRPCPRLPVPSTAASTAGV